MLEMQATRREQGSDDVITRQPQFLHNYNRTLHHEQKLVRHVQSPFTSSAVTSD